MLPRGLAADCSAFTLHPVPRSDRRSERLLTIPFGIDPKQWHPRAGAEQRPASAPELEQRASQPAQQH